MFSREQVRKVMQRLEQNAGGPAAFEDKMARRTLRHSQHFFLQIGANVSSLSAALECASDTVLAGSWVQALQRPSSSSGGGSDDHEMILQHVFSSLLRLHDGLILITSGECRHAADVRAAQSSQYPSHLTASAGVANESSAGRDDYDMKGGDGDGYTTLYRKGSVYCGTGWDEWADSRNGLQRRLVRASGKKWDVLSRGTGIGTMLDRLESEIRNLEDSFASLKAAVEAALVPPLQKRLRAANVKVKLSFQCKMEKMTVVAPAAKYSMEWKRLGAQFQLGDPVLPQGLNRPEWENLLRYNSPPPPQASGVTKKEAASKSHKRKRPNVFVDSDDEDNDPIREARATETRGVDLGNPPASKSGPTGEIVVPTGASKLAMPNTTTRVTATGLVVQRKEKTEPKLCNEMPLDHPFDSINDIKASMGIDVNELEAAHDVLQEEENAGNLEAQRIDSLEDMENQEVLYKKLRKQLDRSLRRDHNQPDDDDLVWELRDRVRLAAMAAGNQNLWAMTGAAPDSSDRADRRKALERALYFFEQAQALVYDQERLHWRMTARLSDSEATSSVFQRNLLLLRGQAHVNAGIALVELVRLKPKSCWKQKAFCEFEAAHTAAESLGDLSASDSGSSIDATIDRHKSRELGLLADRWRGTLLWITGERARATQLLLKNTSITLPVDDETSTDIVTECAEATLKIGIESYLSGATLADLVLIDLEALSAAMVRREESKCEALMKSFEVVVGELVTKSRLLIQAFARIESTWLADPDVLEGNGILNEEELLAMLQETQDWWSRKKTLSLQRIVPDQRQEVMSRSDLSSSVLNEEDTEPNHAPRRRLVVYGSSSFPRKPRRRRPVAGTDFRSAGPAVRMPPPPTSAPQPRRYRRWGDELLPQMMDENGNLVPKLTYPSIAPEMPPEIKERLEALRLANSSQIA